MRDIRRQKTAELMRQILSELFVRQVRDPRLHAVTVTSLRLDAEFQFADIYINALGEEARQTEVMAAVKRASGFLRREVGKRMRLRHIPQLHFHWDPSLAHAETINALLDQLEIPPATAVDEEE